MDSANSSPRTRPGIQFEREIVENFRKGGAKVARASGLRLVLSTYSALAKGLAPAEIPPFRVPQLITKPGTRNICVDHKGRQDIQLDLRKRNVLIFYFLLLLL